MLNTKYRKQRQNKGQMMLEILPRLPIETARQATLIMNWTYINIIISQKFFNIEILNVMFEIKTMENKRRLF